MCKSLEEEALLPEVVTQSLFNGEHINLSKEVVALLLDVSWVYPGVECIC